MADNNKKPIQTKFKTREYTTDPKNQDFMDKLVDKLYNLFGKNKNVKVVNALKTDQKTVNKTVNTQSTGKIAQVASQGTAPESDVESDYKAELSQFYQGLVDVRDIIAPAAMEVDFTHLLIGTKYFRTFFAVTYPTTVSQNWLSPLINFEYPADISTFYYPIDTRLILQKLRRKIGEMEATINLDVEAGKVIDPVVKVNLDSAKKLQEELARGDEKFFQYALYITVRADSLQELEKVSRNAEGTLATIGVVLKPASLRQEEGFVSTQPLGADKIFLTRNVDTSFMANTFPFVSTNLTMDQGILYGMNKHNKSLVIFDRFALENANCVVFATSGAGKSYFVKLEAVRSLMFGSDIIIIDPEREYEKLCQAIGGEYISFTQDGSQKLNPFELSGYHVDGEDELRMKMMSLTGLLKLMLGGTLTIDESVVLEKAISLTYSEKGITPDPATHSKEPPLLEDLYKILLSLMDKEASSLARRLERFLKGSAAGIFDRRSNVNLKNTFTVFSIRDLADEFRPMAMYLMLDFIWTRIKKDKRKRILIIDEAWWMMQYPDAARFVYGIAKRARKYFLGLTTITQDVQDFLDSEYGRAIVTNSSMQILLKQSAAAVERVKSTFFLSEGERNFLLSAGVGEGLFFAGSNHVAIQIIANRAEHRLISTNPIEMNKIRDEIAALNKMDFRNQMRFDAELADPAVKIGQALGEEKQKISDLLASASNEAK